MDQCGRTLFIVLAAVYVIVMLILESLKINVVVGSCYLFFQFQLL